MKKLGKILSLTLLIVLLSVSFAFAGTLELVDSYPRDGNGGFQIENTGVKLYFNKDVQNDNNEAINAASISIVDENGKKMDTHNFYSSKEEGLVLVLVEGLLETDTEYTLSVDEGFVSADGDGLAAPIEITFKTRDTSKDMMVNMILMGIMFAGVMVFSSRNMKKQMAKEAEEKDKDSKVNPYKVSKETGKSVQEVVEKTQKEKEKKEKQESKKKSKVDKNKPEIKEDDKKSINHYKVAGPKPISLSGSTYKTGRKEKAEAKREEAKKTGTTRPKNQSGKTKNKKK